MKYRKVKKYLGIIDSTRWKDVFRVAEIGICPCGYKEGNTPPSADEFKPFENGDWWGSGADSHAWFHFTVNPKDSKREGLYLRAQTERGGWDADNPQFIAYVNGVMRQGLDTNHRDVLLCGEESYDIYLYGYTGPKIDRVRFFADTRYLDREADGLYYDIRYPFEMLDYLDKESGEYAYVLDYLFNAVSMLELYEVGSEDYFRSITRAREYLADEFYGKYCGKRSFTTVGIGHTHIDCAWKWTLKQTREKVQRSFATVLELMKRYPEYKFMSSQALLYQNLKEEAPELYAQVAERIKEGRWECEGAMWVEADCNLSSGESLVRQLLYGKNFFKKEFGVDNRVLWLPDVFGYSAALPQILRKSGVDWFVTSKISWNDTNRMPYDTFTWKGIDGTEINTYFLTAQEDRGGRSGNGTTYVGNTGARMVSGTWKRYQQKPLNSEALLTFGYGDGGGGPTAEHLELARRGAKGVPGGPDVRIDLAGNFLRRLEDRIAGNRNLPKWQGELYLEFHRGTYTTMARNKRCNRKSEFLYQDAELLSVIADSLCGLPFPKEQLHKGWEMILTNQFHDIIPGSSILEVYQQSDRDYAVILGIGDEITEKARGLIAASLAADGGYAIFNPHSFKGRLSVKVDGVTALVDCPVSKGYFCVTPSELSFDCACVADIDGRVLENDKIRVLFDDAWQMISVFDKENERELLRQGEIGNQLRVYADHPDTYDAWEWNEYSRDEYITVTELRSAELLRDGARMGVRLIRPFRKSLITQDIWLTDGSRRVDIETSVDWHQRHVMMKAAFPVDINTDKATYEIQFGCTERPTHTNTSWDRAKFEVCAQKYADISDGGYGVSLLNDCKYGHDIHDGTILLSLLRSSTDPNPEADQGEHIFTYSLYPHTGRVSDGDTVREAYFLNMPLAAVKLTGENDRLPRQFSAVSVDCDNVVVETVKAAEDSSDTVIRMYECHNKRTKVKVDIGLPARRVFVGSMMEEPVSELILENGAVELTLGGFEIVTLIVQK